MKKGFALLVFLLCSFTYFNAYGKDFGNDDGVIISLPKFVDKNNIVVCSEFRRANIIDKSENYSNEYVTVNIYKPEVYLSNNFQSETLINTKIDNIVNSFKDKVIEDSKRDNEFNLQNGLPIKQYVVAVNNTVNYNKDNIISVTLHLYSYTGGAHGSTTDISLNMDTNTGNNGVLKDFLGNNKDYEDIILKEIKKQVAKNPEMYFQEEVDKLSKLPYNQKFFITEDSVVVYFDEYAIAPYVAGRPQFSISFNKFPKGLNKVNIEEESPAIKTLFYYGSNTNSSYSQYICIPQLECYSNPYKYINLNMDIREKILKDIEEISKEEGVQGITSYYIYNYKNKNKIEITTKYIVNKNEEAYEETTKKYVVDLRKNIFLKG